MTLMNLSNQPHSRLGILQRCLTTVAELLAQFFMTETANEANEAETFSEPGSVAPAIRLLDREAIVTETIQPDHPGRVRYRGSWWSARCDRDITLLPNTVVYVIGRYHLTLLVEPKV